MSVSDDDVRKVSRLARLAILDENVHVYAEKLSGILDMVDQLNAVDTTGVEPLSNPLDSVQRLREDVVTETNQREKYQSVAPEVEKGLYLVPKVLD
jgi:aspartyl-tRNA(Asn)/glutamyl-tRNA(Gln) amidotransferase subunit C